MTPLFIGLAEGDTISGEMRLRTCFVQLFIGLAEGDTISGVANIGTDTIDAVEAGGVSQKARRIVRPKERATFNRENGLTKAMAGVGRLVKVCHLQPLHHGNKMSHPGCGDICKGIGCSCVDREWFAMPHRKM